LRDGSEEYSQRPSKVSHLTSHIPLLAVVGELTAVGRRSIVRTAGRSSSENAGISSESKVRIFTVENLRFPGEGSSAQGKSGPKPRPRGVGDGQQVEIPVLPSLD
jgi:hypothetical protein